MIYDLGLRTRRQPSHKSQVINRKSLQADGLGRAGVDAYAAIDTVVRVHFRLVIRHADRAAGALAHAGLTARTLFPIDFGRHFITLSK